MPIVVAVLGIIIVILGVTFFLVDKEEPVRPGEEVVETQTEPTTIPETEETEPLTEPTVSTTPVPGVPGVVETVSVPEETANVIATKVFTEDAEYITPARTEHKISVALTINADLTVVDADVTYDGGTGFSNPNQERFDGAYKAEVIGKSLADISLSRVGGASLTSKAFNEAVAKIEAEIETL